MENETNEEVVVTAEETTEEIVTPDEGATEEEKEDYREKLNIQNRFLKKEGYEFKEGKWVKPVTTEKKEAVQSNGMSLTDSVAILNAKVHEDDIERVERFAKSEGVSIKDALKNPEMKAILDMREEQRTVASASNVSNVRRGSTKVSDDVLISNARANKLPESDDDIARLISAKAKQKD